MEEGRKKVLIVDDEPAIRRSLELLLQNTFEVKTAEDGEVALATLRTFQPDVILLDVMMPRLDGIETLSAIRKEYKNVPVVMLTAANEVKTAVAAMKCGAVDYLGKPFDVDELTNTLLQVLSVGEREKEVSVDSSLENSNSNFGVLVGEAPSMKDVFNSVQQVSSKDATVLITGESGTGKELLAREIHKRSKRASGPFIPLNCAAIPESLIESELFGHEKGAFTGAGETRVGFCELANGGTLFLDEIGELSLGVQVKLLRFLQEQEFFRVGRSKPIKVNVRIVTATNKNLEQLVKEGKFRQDLYYRIHVVHIQIPPLRERYEDIPILTKHFCDKFSAQYGSRNLTFTPEAHEILLQYGWPGNVRELENVIESILATFDGDVAGVECLPRKLTQKEEVYSGREVTLDGGLKFEDAEKKFETEMIIRALKKTNFVQTKAAELLGISRRILKYKMDKLGISERDNIS